MDCIRKMHRSEEESESLEIINEQKSFLKEWIHF